MWDTLLGGVLAMLGGWGALYVQMRQTRKIKMDEVVAERKVATNAKAYSCVKEIQGAFIQHGTEAALTLIANYEAWFFENRLFLPGEFPSKWLSIRNDLSKLIRCERQDPMPADARQEAETLMKRVEKSCTDAIMEIYKDMDLKPINLNANGG